MDDVGVSEPKIIVGHRAGVDNALFQRPQFSRPSGRWLCSAKDFQPAAVIESLRNAASAIAALIVDHQYPEMTGIVLGQQAPYRMPDSFDLITRGNDCHN